MSDFEPYIPLASAIVGAGTSIYGASQSRKAQKKAMEQAQQLSVPPVMPLPQSAAEMPVPSTPESDSEKVLAAKRRSLVEQLARRGRASTILTDDTLGG